MNEPCQRSGSSRDRRHRRLAPAARARAAGSAGSAEHLVPVAHQRRPDVDALAERALDGVAAAVDLRPDALDPDARRVSGGQRHGCRRARILRVGWYSGRVAATPAEYAARPMPKPLFRWAAIGGRTSLAPGLVPGSKRGDAMAGVTFDGVSKVYPDGTRAVDRPRASTSRTASSWCSSARRAAARRRRCAWSPGSRTSARAACVIGDRVVNHVPSRDRDIAMVFQSYALYPHLSVYENIAFGLRVKKVPKAEIDTRVKRRGAHARPRAAARPQAARRSPAASASASPWAARSCASPQAFLMDEPLSNLDAKLRVQMRAEIARLQHDLGVTTIYVTHDQVEAMTMGDRVAVMRKGELQQVDTPQELYDRPVNLFVGRLHRQPGDEPARGHARDGAAATPSCASARRRSRSTTRRSPRTRRSQAYDGREIILGIRPEDLEDADARPDAPADRRLKGKVRAHEALGSEVMVHFSIDARARGRPRTCTSSGRHRRRPRAGQRASASEGAGAVLVGRFGAALAGRARATRSRSPSTRAPCTSSIPRPLSGSMTTPPERSPL